MSAHGFVTGLLGVAVFGLGAYVVARPVPLVVSPDAETARLSDRLDALDRRVGDSADRNRALKRGPRGAARSVEQPVAPETASC